MMKRFALIALPLLAPVLTITACTAEKNGDADTETAAEAPVNAALDAVLAADIRADDRARDTSRHPGETLNFFGVEADHTVIEYAPGGGWYTRVIAPYVSENGQYVAVSFGPDAVASMGEDFAARVREGAETFSVKQSESLGIAADKLPFHFGGAIPAELNGTVDRVIIPRMMHNLMRWGVADSQIEALKATLKPDGMIGIIQHRAKADAPADYTDGNKGYLKQADVIAFMEKHGFALAAESEINANPKDSADYPKGVWTLPPSFAEGDADKEKYEAIGESDRMTLLFRLAEA